jgi:hypothetical protein
MLTLDGNSMNIQRTQPIKWWYWYVVILLLPIALGVGAIEKLVQSPEPADCVSESLSNQEAASVFYCATMLAKEENADKLYQAIKLLDTMPKNHPLRSEKLMEKWSLEILNFSENAIQSGKLDQAIEIANLIPDDVPAHQIALTKIEHWKSIWSKAEAIHQAAKKIIQKDHKNSWYLALNKAKELRKIDNDYWANTKYHELVHYIQHIMEKDEDIKHLEKNNSKFITTQDTDSMYQWQIKQEAEDIAKLKKARILASSGNIENMRSAIDEVNMITSDQQYEEAQKFMTDIKNKIQKNEDSSYLQQAKKLALKNDVISLHVAISKASIISNESHLYKEANKNIEQWKHQISQMTANSQPLQQTIIIKTNTDNLNKLEDLQLNEMTLDSVSENNSAKFPTP